MRDENEKMKTLKTSKKKKKNGEKTKFKVRCSRYLYTLVVNDTSKVDRIKQSLPPTLEVKDRTVSLKDKKKK